jgi:hypothetical protein
MMKLGLDNCYICNKNDTWEVECDCSNIINICTSCWIRRTETEQAQSGAPYWELKIHCKSCNRDNKLKELI